MTKLILLVVLLLSSFSLTACTTLALQGAASKQDVNNADTNQTAACPIPDELKPITGNEVGAGRGPDVLPSYPGTVRLSLYEPPE